MNLNPRANSSRCSAFSINLDKKQILGQWGAWGEWLSDGTTVSLIEHLAEPNKPLSEDTDMHLVNIQPPPRQFGILRLPYDIMSLVFAEMDNLKDVLRLGLTCRLFVSMNLAQIHAIRVNAPTHWAGDRLICIGSGTKSRGLPKNILTDTELLDLGFKSESECNTPTNVYRVAIDNSCKPHTHRYLNYSDVIRAEDSTDYAAVPYRARLAEHAIFHRLNEPDYPSGIWVLANLSKRVFVRASSESISGLDKQPHSFNDLFAGDYPTLGAVLLSRISWADGPFAMGMQHGTNEKLYHGVWAGDRFTITTIDKVDQREGEKEWEDVSEEVMEDMVEIWKMEHGDMLMDAL